MIESSRTSSSHVTASENSRSALSAPIVSLPSLIGTQMNEMSCFCSRFRAPVRFRNSGSCEMRGTIAGAAGLDDLAGDPFAAPVDSPLPLARRQPVRRLDVDLPRPAVQQRQRPAHHAHVPRHRVEHRVDRVAEVHAPVERLADLEQQREFLHLALDRRARGVVRLSDRVHVAIS